MVSWFNHRYSRTAQALVLKRWETDVAFSGHPQIGLLLEVQPADDRPFQAEVKTVVTRAQLSHLFPGAFIEVSYSPSEPDHVAITALPGAE